MPMTRPARLVSTGGLRVLAGITAGMFLRHHDPGEKRRPEDDSPVHAANVSFPVRTAVARTGDLIQHLTTSGTLRAGREVEIQARVGGYLTDVPL